MLGSAIPRRWVLSLALVGLVSILVASYTAVWSDAALADSDGQGTGTGTGTGFSADQKLDDVQQLPQGIQLFPGQQNFISAVLLDENGVQRTTFQDTTFDWDVSGSGISIIGDDDERSVTVQANSVGSATLQVTIEQGATTQAETSFYIRQTVIEVVSPGPTPTPITPPTNPGPVPSSIPNASGVIAPEESLLISTDGPETGSSPQSSSLSGKPVVFIPVGSVSDFFGVNVEPLDVADLEPLPSGYNMGSSAADIVFVNEDGEAQTTFRLLRSAEVCLPVSGDDLAGASGYTGLRVLRYNSVVEQWVVLNTTYNVVTQQACAHSSNFSIFALGLAQVQATPPSGPGLPATGGWSPTAGLLILAGLVGIVMVGGGVFTMRRARREDLGE